MATALFVTTKDIKRYSVLSGNVDPDKFIYMVEIAMDTQVQNYTGTVLYEKLQDLISTGDISLPANSDYLSLLETYLKPMTIYWALVTYMPFAAYTVANGGVYKHTSESAVTVDKTEVDYLVEKYRDIAQFYTNNFIEFMIYNQSTFPEYNENKEDDFYPDTSCDFGGWVL
ncbi:MAG: hypothetical protein Unbinned5607contig1000_37 [Prokaryotic dsDNA virus sp.]|nr:MAG: hypothetical protein Unbinned5607contig1000_37 [Prokaryotic dsDNA virus sp.]|tara:strand:+ start:16199 stop:16711 length:513 start_codon:yes stop_codon:yes gene_type:complete